VYFVSNPWTPGNSCNTFGLVHESGRSDVRQSHALGNCWLLGMLFWTLFAPYGKLCVVRVL
jgi:hypothetical protein